MQPWQIIDRTTAPDGAEWVLARRGDEWVVRAGGRVLMSSRAHHSEEALASMALARASRRSAVLLGGLGLGYTLRAALDRMPEASKVVVCELVPALVDWNRVHVSHLAGRPLDDRRVRLQPGDVVPRIAEAKRAYDAILLDVDNGPSALAHPKNDRLYGARGIAACREALRPGGVLAVWSAGPDEPYRERLEKLGFEVETPRVQERPGGGKRHTLFLGRVPLARPGRRGSARAARPE